MAPWWLRASDDEVPLEDEVDSPTDQETAPSDDGPASDPATQTAHAPTRSEVPAWKSRTTGDEDSESEVAGDRKTAKAAEGQDRTDESEETPREAPKRRRRRRRRRRSSSTTRSEEQPAEAKPEKEAVAKAETVESEEPAPEPQADPPRKSEAKKQEAKKQRSDPEPKEAPKADVEKRESRKPEPEEPEPLAAPSLPSPPSLDRNLALPLMPDRSAAQDERKIAVFCDFENIALGVRDSEVKKLDINLVLARLLEKGKIIVKKAYADWERYSDYKRPFHEAAIELIDIPQKYYSGKNSADIKLVVDAMDLCYSKEHLDTFVIVSGDSDFSPLVSKLKENNKYVIGIGVKNASSSLLTDNCDEFIYYEDVWRSVQQRPRLDNLQPKEAEVFGLMADAMLALIRENKEVLWGSMIKQTMQRKRPSFNESTYGYATFSELLEDAARKNIIGVRKDQRSGNYVVTGFVPNR